MEDSQLQAGGSKAHCMCDWVWAGDDGFSGRTGQHSSGPHPVSEPQEGEPTNAVQRPETRPAQEVRIDMSILVYCGPMVHKQQVSAARDQVSKLIRHASQSSSYAANGDPRTRGVSAPCVIHLIGLSNYLEEIDGAHSAARSVATL
jgi:hypothetical protein